MQLASIDDLSWIATKPKLASSSKFPGGSALTFQIGSSAHHDLFQLTKWKPFLLIMVSHMSSYHDAGWVELRVCGVTVAILDALWVTPRTMMTERSFKVDLNRLPFWS